MLKLPMHVSPAGSRGSWDATAKILLVHPCAEPFRCRAGAASPPASPQPPPPPPRLLPGPLETSVTVSWRLARGQVMRSRDCCIAWHSRGTTVGTLRRGWPGSRLWVGNSFGNLLSLWGLLGCCPGAALSYPMGGLCSSLSWERYKLLSLH